MWMIKISSITKLIFDNIFPYFIIEDDNFFRSITVTIDHGTLRKLLSDINKYGTKVAYLIKKFC